jgi:hypothetical protein
MGLVFGHAMLDIPAFVMSLLDFYLVFDGFEDTLQNRNLRKQVV